jgi:hypothetical protein
MLKAKRRIMTKFAVRNLEDEVVRRAALFAWIPSGVRELAWSYVPTGTEPALGGREPFGLD